MTRRADVYRTQFPTTAAPGTAREVPAARARCTSTGVVINEGFGNIVPFDWTDFSVGGMTVTDGSTIVIPHDGIYQASAQVLFSWSDPTAHLTNPTYGYPNNWAGGFNEDGYVAWDEASNTAPFYSTVVNTGGGEGAINCLFDGSVEIFAGIQFNDGCATPGATARLAITLNGADVADSGEVEPSDPVFGLGASASVAVGVGDQIRVRVYITDFAGPVPGPSDDIYPTGAYNHFVTVTRTDFPLGPEIAIVQRNSSGSYIDAVAASDAVTRRALAAGMAFQASAGDQLQVWAFNPASQPDGGLGADVVAGPYLNAYDTIMSSVDNELGPQIYSEFQAAWVGPGTGARPSGGEE